MKRKLIGVALPILFAISLRAQEFKVFDRSVQVHGFVSQGIAYTNQNNWLTMKTSEGSYSYTDFGVNMSASITDKFRIGAQMYDRNLGNLGNWHPSLDWAVADYRFARWFGIRGGKVKTVIGLYNDTQDLDFLRPFALLPQSIYSTDMRESTIAHMGGDVYGDISLGKKRGTLSYTGYAGKRQDSEFGGYPYLLDPIGIHFTSYGGLQVGGDLRWRTPLNGLVVGASRMNEEIDGDGTFDVPGIGSGSYHESSKADWTNQYYGQYTKGKFDFASEYRRYYRFQSIFNGAYTIQTDVRGWYFSGAYQALKRLQIGSYYSHYTLSSPDYVYGAVEGHIYDKVVTARVDLNRFCNVKLEGHFMEGVGVPGLYPSGFYDVDNPQGLKPDTMALIVKTGFNF